MSKPTNQSASDYHGLLVGSLRCNLPIVFDAIREKLNAPLSNYKQTVDVVKFVLTAQRLAFILVNGRIRDEIMHRFFTSYIAASKGDFVEKNSGYKEELTLICTNNLSGKNKGELINLKASVDLDTLEKIQKDILNFIQYLRDKGFNWETHDLHKHPLTDHGTYDLLYPIEYNNIVIKRSVIATQQYYLTQLTDPDEFYKETQMSKQEEEKRTQANITNSRGGSKTKKKSTNTNVTTILNNK